MSENKIFLSSDDFESNRLNKSFFTNIHKGVSVSDFQKEYPSDKFQVFEKGIVENFIRETYESTGGEIVKGGFNDTEQVAEVLENLKNTVSLLKGVTIDINNQAVEVFVMPKAIVADTLEKGKDSDQLEKGRIRDSLYYSELNMSFNKSGKEIKEKLIGLKTIETAKLVAIQSDLNTCEDMLGHKPTESHGSGSDLMKTFKWDMTYKQESNVSFGNDASGTLTEEQCNLNRAWNDAVYQFREITEELNAIKLLEDNIEDSKKYELTARQMLNFGF